MWERAGRLQDACDGSYFNGLPLFTGGSSSSNSEVQGRPQSGRNPVRLITPPWRREDGEEGEMNIDEVEYRGAARCAEKEVDVAEVANWPLKV